MIFLKRSLPLLEDASDISYRGGMKFKWSSPLQVFMNQHRRIHSSFEEESIGYRFRETILNKINNLFLEVRNKTEKSSFAVEGKLILYKYFALPTRSNLFTSFR